jgi:hypothetical protein
MSRDHAAQEAFVAVSSSENPVPDELDPDLAAWKEVDRQLIRKGMKRIDEAKLEFEKLVEKYWGKGTVERWQREGPSEPETEEFHAWLWVDWRKTRRSKTLAEAMATDLSVSGEERQILAALNASHRAVYQVVRIDPGRGVELENVLEGGRVFVHDRGFSLSAEKWSLVFCHAYPAGPYHFAAGGAHAFSPRQKDFIKAYLSYELQKYRRNYPSAGWREFLRARPEIFGRLTVKLHERMRQLPRLVNTDGEPLALCKVRFEVGKPEEFLAGLRAHQELEELTGCEKEEVEFVWQGRRGEKTVLLGRIVLAGNGLLLECNSRERVARGSNLLKQVGLIEVRGEEIKEGQKVLEEARARLDRGLAERDDVLPEPPPEAQAYLQEAMRRHYEDWVDHPLPALDGKTPREAAKDPRSRRMLIDLLREMEYMDQRGSHPGYGPFDWNKMRRRLGLAEE